MMLLISDPRDPERFLTWSSRSRDRFWARALAPALDRRLAVGDPPESSRLLALRAQTLALMDTRRALARHWEHLLRVSHGQAARVPLCRPRIAAAEPDIKEMLRALVTALPTPARGVAMASVLLGDGAGPLYSRHCSVDLGTALREATTHLDPSTALAASA